MVDWIKKRLEKDEALTKIVEELLDELISKDSGNQYGMDNMSAILIRFKNKK
jgi:serine/threonine protein phosphatase PrpC